MILTVTLNAAIDRTVAVPSFRQGHRHRAVEASTVAGGKGVNVARALKLLDRPVIATGLAGGPTGARLMERLAEESILTDFTWIAGESRTNLAVVDPLPGSYAFTANRLGPQSSSVPLNVCKAPSIWASSCASTGCQRSSRTNAVDGPPLRVKLLGEDLIAFRDSTGRVG